MDNNIIDYLKGLEECASRVRKVIELNPGLDPLCMYELAYVEGYLSTAKYHYSNQLQESTDNQGITPPYLRNWDSGKGKGLNHE